MSKFLQQNGKKSRNIQAENITINYKETALSDSNSNLGDKINNNPLKIYFGIAIVAFGLGFSARVGIETASNQDLVTKDSYKLLIDIEKEYVLKSQHDEEIQKYTLQISNYEKDTNELQNKIASQEYYAELVKRYDALLKERKGFENELNNLINFYTGIKNDGLKPSYDIKKEELLRKIASRDEQIKILLEKIK